MTANKKFNRRVRDRMHSTGEKYTQARAGLIADEAVRAFNASVKVGDPVRFWPGAREGEGRQACTRSEAWAMGGTMAVVKVTGYAGGIALTHVQPVTPPDPAPSPDGSGGTE